MTVVVDKFQPQFGTFKEVEVGDIFKWNNLVYLKTSNSVSVENNALNLFNREASLFREDQPVQLVNATIIIEAC